MPENERESDHIEGNGIHFRNLDYLRLVNSRCKVQDGCAGGFRVQAPDLANTQDRKIIEENVLPLL